MKNKDKYNLKECDIKFENGTVTLKNQKFGILFKNYKAFIEWLEDEYKEPIKLTEAERIILENIDSDWKWIARNKNRELYIYTSKPIKGECNRWVVGYDYTSLKEFKHLFEFIKWEDEEPYNITKLLETCEVANK